MISWANLQLHVRPDKAKMVEALVANIRDYARCCIEERGRFSVVLAGGGTPRTLYESLRVIETQWQHWHVYFSDERCLPHDDPQRNAEMAKQALLRYVGIPESQIHQLPSGSDEYSILDYQRQLDREDVFDLVLLGLGEDGHTASLFPGCEWEGDSSTPDIICVKNAPKPPARRISLSASRLARTRALWFVVSGSAKRKALQQLQSGDEQIPATHIPAQCVVDIFADASALE